jgi:hypothetical protein
MWKPSKTILFLFMLIPAIIGGITLNFADWSTIENGKGFIKEFQLPVILLILSFVFMLKYVKKLKSEQ